MVLKPTEKTPLSALLLADILYEAGLPPQMFSVVTGDPREIADEMLTNPDVDLVTFTGGVAVGKYIAAKAVYKRQVLELGGNDPHHRDGGRRPRRSGDARRRGLVQEFRPALHGGQAHARPASRVADRFVELLLAKTRAVKYGDPMDPTIDMGTVIDEAAAKSFEAKVDDAVARGARAALRQRAQRRAVLADGARPRDARHAGREVRDVRSGVAGDPLRDIDDAIRIANSAPTTDLSSAVCTNRLDYITRFVSELNVGTVNVREVPGYRLELTPFGGIKDSGLGYKEGVQEAMKSFTNVKTYSLPW